jgi:hypothetical protein
VRAGAGISVVNPLTALDYAESGVVVRRFSVDVPFGAHQRADRRRAVGFNHHPSFHLVLHK